MPNSDFKIKMIASDRENANMTRFSATSVGVLHIQTVICVYV